MKKREKIARMPLRVVLYRDESDKSVLIAHCLEFDLLGCGKDRAEALSLLVEAITIQLENTLRSGNYKNLFTAAPAEYQLMYAKGRDVADDEMKIEIHTDDFEIDEIDAREYDDGYSDSEANSKLVVA